MDAPADAPAGAPRHLPDVPGGPPQMTEAQPPGQGPLVLPGRSQPPGRAGRGKVAVRVPRRREAGTEALRETLLDKEAEANDLRVALEELRHALDAEAAEATGPVAPRPRRRRGLAWIVAAVAAVAALALLGVLAVRGPWRADPAESAGTGPLASGSTSTGSPSTGTPSGSRPGASSAPSSTGPTTGPSPAATAPAPEVAVRPLPWPGGAVLVPQGAATSGPGVDRPGSDVLFAVDPDGRHLDVFERVILPDLAARELTLRQAKTSGLASQLGVRAPVRVVGLQAQVGDAGVRITAGAGRTWRIPLPPERAGEPVVLRYRLDGALLTLPRSPAGRALGLVTPLSASASSDAGQPVTVAVRDAGVMSLTCPTAPGGARLCGEQSGTSWRATLPGTREPVALVQVDLGSRG